MNRRLRGSHSRFEYFEGKTPDPEFDHRTVQLVALSLDDAISASNCSAVCVENWCDITRIVSGRSVLELKTQEPEIQLSAW
jgi:hypothetical protein